MGIRTLEQVLVPALLGWVVFFPKKMADLGFTRDVRTWQKQWERGRYKVSHNQPWKTENWARALRLDVTLHDKLVPVTRTVHMQFESLSTLTLHRMMIERCLSIISSIETNNTEGNLRWYTSQ